MGNNGHHKLNFAELGRVRVYLAYADDNHVASAWLAQEGLHYEPRDLARLRRSYAEGIASLRESGLAAALVGPSARHARRIERLDALCTQLEDRICREAPALDRELAGLLQQYRELAALVFAQDPPSPAQTPPARSGENDSQMAATLTLLEALNHEEPPPGDSTEDLCDAARRLAAATGGAFATPQPDQSYLAGDERGLRAAAGPSG